MGTVESRLCQALLLSDRYIRCAGSVLTIAGKAIQALQYKPTGATVDSSYGTFPTLPVPVSYPQTASFTMLTLEPPYYTPEVSSTELIPAARSRQDPSVLSAAFSSILA